MFVSLLAGAQTVQVEGVQSGTWNADTILVTGDIDVVNVLRILPGTTVLFDGFYGITIHEGASFVAKGRENDSVVFTVSDTTGFHIYNSNKGGWNGICLMKAGKLRLDHCVLQYAKAADTLDRQGGALNILGSDEVNINHCTLRYNRAREHGGAIYAVDSKVKMSQCALNYNKVEGDEIIYAMYGGAAGFLKCDVSLTDMEFIGNVGERCIGGALSLDSCSLTLDRAVFSHNIGINGGGMYLMRCNHKECRLSNLLFANNLSRHFAGGLAFCDASPEVYNITVTGNASEGVNCNGIFFYQNCSPKMTNCIVYGNYPLENEIGGDTIQMWVWTYDETAPEFRNCLVENLNKSITNFEYISVFEDVMDVDPLFVDPENGNFRLSEDSPCRDAGKVMTPQYLLEGLDLDGMPRLANRRVDLGPYEFSPESVDETDMGKRLIRLLGNPLNEESRLMVELEEPGLVEVRFISLLGRVVVEKSFGSRSAGATVLPVGDLATQLSNGLYLVEVVINGKTFTLKAIK